MKNIRMTHPVDPKLNYNCDLMHIESYHMEEVMLPATKNEKTRKAIRIHITGRNFKSVAQPLFALVGKIPVKYLRIAPDERSVEGILLEEPQPGEYVDMILADEDAARHPTPVDTNKIVRMK
jgi:hypothetical protein